MNDKNMIIQAHYEFITKITAKDAEKLIGKPFLDLNGNKIGEVIDSSLIDDHTIKYTAEVTDEDMIKKIMAGITKHLCISEGGSFVYDKNNSVGFATPFKIARRGQ